ncbi:MFS transporter, partial [Mycobacterium kansasii]
LALQREVAAKNAGKETVAAAPLSEAIRKHWVKILLGAGLLAGTNSAFYVSIAGFVSYGSKKPSAGGLGMNSNSILACVLA